MKMLTEIRRLWLFAPDGVVRAANAFVEAGIGKGREAVMESWLKEFILEMRKDSTFAAALVPKFFWTRLSAAEIGVRTANRELLAEKLQLSSKKE
jgi:hypothetical protein